MEQRQQLAVLAKTGEFTVTSISLPIRISLYALPGVIGFKGIAANPLVGETKSGRKLGLPRDVPFDYQLAMDRLRDFRAPRDKLRRLCESGAIIQVKRGLYIAGPNDEARESADARVLPVATSRQASTRAGGR